MQAETPTKTFAVHLILLNRTKNLSNVEKGTICNLKATL